MHGYMYKIAKFLPELINIVGEENIISITIMYNEELKGYEVSFHVKNIDDVNYFYIWSKASRKAYEMLKDKNVYILLETY